MDGSVMVMIMVACWMVVTRMVKVLVKALMIVIGDYGIMMVVGEMVRWW